MRIRHLLALALVLLVPSAGAQGAPPAAVVLPRLLRSIPLPRVEGRIDHLAVDAAEKRLALAALGNDTLEVLDLEAGRVLHTQHGLGEPQGVQILPDTGRIAVTCGADGSLRLFDGVTFEAAGALDLGGDADNLRIEAGTGRLVAGFGAGGLAFVKDAAVAARATLSGHPESFQLAIGSPRIFVNVPAAGHVALVDGKAARVLATWPLRGARDNFPMAFDEAHERLLVGCRSPARLLALDTTPEGPRLGTSVATLEISGDVDDIWIDAPARRIYLSCGEGFLDVVEQTDADHYARVGRVPTATGARTSLFVPASGHLYLAVPHRGTQGAEVRVYATRP